MSDESGVALGLAVIMIVLIGVMGAGLLVFVQSDLKAVVEVNQGQRAFEMADAGAHAARQHILGDKRPAHYDVDATSDPDYLDAGCNIDNESTVPARIGEDWSPDGAKWPPEASGTEGVTRNFAGGQFHVTIRWLNSQPPLGTPAECVAPVTGTAAQGVDYFKVVSTGTFGGAIRKVEVIYDTYSLHVPKAYYTPGRVNIAGTACIANVSIFSGESVDFDGGGDCKDAAGNSLNSHFKGLDLNYGDWNNPPSDKFNTTARGTDAAGVGAVGAVTDSTSLNFRDYGSNSNPVAFVASPSKPQKATEISFPFNIRNQPNADQLCETAKERDAYDPAAYALITTSGNASLNTWPDNSNEDTVVCREFASGGASNVLKWAVNGATNLTGDYAGCKGPEKRGTLVIKGGSFSTQPNTALFRGVVVVRGTSASSELGSSTDTGNTCLDGFVNASGMITIAGTVRPSAAVAEDRLGFYGVRPWSWRELYQ